MSDTVELWTLRDENAALRRQLAESQRQRDEWEKRARETLAAGQVLSDGFNTADGYIADLVRQRDEAQAACATMRQAWIEEGFSLDSLPSSGRDFLARAEAAQRTAQAADGLAKASKYYCDANDLRCEINRVQDCGQCAVCRVRAALAAYQATKEQK